LATIITPGSLKLKRLPIETQQALQRLASLGNRAEFALLEMGSQQSNDKMHAPRLPPDNHLPRATRPPLTFAALRRKSTNACNGARLDDRNKGIHLSKTGSRHGVSLGSSERPIPIMREYRTLILPPTSEREVSTNTILQ
jgi:hypothetical protein